ncbi:MAG TPA: zf-HC2 domain-containing protein [Pyrinomonadaceae bacterium]|nr:zf-HC2 domain-containing protein [Pyrinomonadaceae bacterium]
MNCSYTEKISSLIDGELSAGEAREVERHVLTCSECELVRADFLNLRNQLTSFETSLQPQVQNRALKKILAGPRRAPSRGLQWNFGTGALAFATLLIVAAIIGLLAYQSSNQREPKEVAVVQQTPSPMPAASVEPSKSAEAKESPEPQPSPNKSNEEKPRPTKRIVREPKPGEQFAAIPERVRSADAETMTAMHFETSERLLLAFKNVRLDEVNYERKRAKQLVLQNMLLKREADTAGDVQISSLLENLEPILIDIANLPDKPDEDTVRAIRERVERKNIVGLLRVNSTALARALD